MVDGYHGGGIPEEWEPPADHELGLPDGGEQPVSDDEDPDCPLGMHEGYGLESEPEAGTFPDDPDQEELRDLNSPFNRPSPWATIPDPTSSNPINETPEVLEPHDADTSALSGVPATLLAPSNDLPRNLPPVAMRTLEVSLSAKGQLGNPWEEGLKPKTAPEGDWSISELFEDSPRLPEREVVASKLPAGAAEPVETIPTEMIGGIAELHEAPAPAPPDELDAPMPVPAVPDIPTGPGKWERPDSLFDPPRPPYLPFGMRHFDAEPPGTREERHATVIPAHAR